ncbi:hypothetical protein C7E12_20395, partial [Stenotrophomonas maltophilia]
TRACRATANAERSTCRGMYPVRMKNLIWLALGLFAGNAVADDGVIYRCTSSNSDVPTLQRRAPVARLRTLSAAPAVACTLCA